MQIYPVKSDSWAPPGSVTWRRALSPFGREAVS